MHIEDCKIIDMPKINDPRGNLTFVEGGRHIPFAFKRIFYLYDVPSGEMRAGHALKTCEQFLIAISGSFDVLVDDGVEKKRYRLDRSFYGLYLPPLIWREIENFSANAVCLALASDFYDEAGYYRQYDEFLNAVKGSSK